METTQENIKYQLYEIGLLAFLTGFFSLCIQVISTHYAFLSHPQSSYAIGLSLFSFLTGLGIASSISVAYQEFLLRNFRRLMAWVFTGVGLYFLAITLFSNELRETVRKFCMVLPVNPDTRYIASIAIMSIIFLLIPAVALGLLFPVINDRRSRMKGAETGKTSFFDYLGAGTGALLCSFSLVPVVGLKNSSLMISTFLLVAAIPWHGNFFRFLLVAVALAIPQVGTRIALGQVSGLHSSFIPRTVLFNEPSPFGEVTVMSQVDNPGVRTLMIEQRIMCGSHANVSERLLASIPLQLIKRDNLDILNVGLGCGATAHEIRSHRKTKSLDVVEINPVIVKANSFFDYVHPPTPVMPFIHIYDGYDYLRTTSKKYDLIIVDVEEPSVIHSSALFTKDFFSTVKKRLADDGFFSVWTACEPATGRIVLNTLRSVFPFAQLRVFGYHLVFVAANKEFDLNPWPGSKKLLRRVMNMPQKEIATVADNPYAKYFKVTSIFHLPEWYEDPHEMRE